MQKIKAVLYPFSQESIYISRNSRLSDYEIIAAVIPGQLPENYMNMRYFDEYTESDILLQNDFYQAISLTDTIILAPYDYKDIPYYQQQVFENIVKAITLHKNIVCLEMLNEKNIKKYTVLAEENQVEFIYFNSKDDSYQPEELSALDKIETPVITVIGMTEYTNKFETQLFIREALLQSGYTVSQIGSRACSPFFGFHAYPAFMFENQLSEKQKILNLNHYIHHIEITENPDVIVIGIPGEVMKLNDNILFHFGTNVFLAGCAYVSDFTVLSIGCTPLGAEEQDKLENLLRYRFSMNLNALFISNIRFNEDVYKLNKTNVDYDILPKELFYPVKEKCKNSFSIPVFDLWDDKNEFIEYLRQILC